MESFSNNEKLYLYGSLNNVYKIYWNVYHNNNYDLGDIENEILTIFLSDCLNNFNISISTQTNNFKTNIKTYIDRTDLPIEEKINFKNMIHTLNLYLRGSGYGDLSSSAGGLL